jgi:hypothetical protein
MSKPAVFLAAIFIAWNESTGHAQSPKRIEIIVKGFTYDPDTRSLYRSYARYRYNDISRNNLRASFNALAVGMVPAYLFAKADLGSITEASINLL